MKNMRMRSRSILILCKALLLLTLCFPGMLLAANEAAFHMQAKTQGNQVVVEVRAEHLSDVYAYQFNLAYPTEAVRFISATSPIAGFTVEPIDQDGDILFAHSKVGSVSGTQGGALLATFTFERVAGSGASFSLHGIKLVDSNLDMVSLPDTVQLASTWITFSDIAGHWAEPSIIKASELGLVQGYSNSTFRPQQQVTRAEFITLLSRALGVKPSSAPVLDFKDTAHIPAWAGGYVAAAVELGIIQGYADGTFQAAKLISRAEMAAMIVRSQGIVPLAEIRPAFADNAEIPAWARPYIAIAAEQGWINGVGNNRFAPLQYATRAESAHLILTLYLSLP